jgi:hypothetical protein
VEVAFLVVLDWQLLEIELVALPSTSVVLLVLFMLLLLCLSFLSLSLYMCVCHVSCSALHWCACHVMDCTLAAMSLFFLDKN